jgi:hypothetical protein
VKITFEIARTKSKLLFKSEKKAESQTHTALNFATGALCKRSLAGSRYQWGISLPFRAAAGRSRTHASLTTLNDNARRASDGITTGGIWSRVRLVAIAVAKGYAGPARRQNCDSSGFPILTAEIVTQKDFPDKQKY